MVSLYINLDNVLNYSEFMKPNIVFNYDFIRLDNLLDDSEFIKLE